MDNVLIIPAAHRPLVASMELSLENMQYVVGGYIEVARSTDRFALLCNEEGRLIGLPVNGNVPDLCGDLLLCGIDGEDFCGLSQQDLTLACALLEVKL